jgi:hypothetical protein
VPRVEWNMATYAGVAAEFETLLAASPNEQTVQRFLKRYPYIVRNALNVHAWNSVHLKAEFPFGRNYVADFLILSEDSGGWHTVLIELESPTARPFTKKGSPSSALSKGLAQLDEWKIWIGRNDTLFREQLSSLFRLDAYSEHLSSSDREDAAAIRDPHTVIDKEYIVVVGRRSSFADSETQERRAVYRGRGQQIRSYDRLLDMARHLDPSAKSSV